MGTADSSSRRSSSPTSTSTKCSRVGSRCKRGVLGGSRNCSEAGESHVYAGVCRVPRVARDRARDQQRGWAHAGARCHRYGAGARLARGGATGEGTLVGRDRDRGRRTARREHRGAPELLARAGEAMRGGADVIGGVPNFEADPPVSEGIWKRCSRSPRSSTHRLTRISTSTRIRVRRRSSCSPT
jgi:hypothetical protein